MKKIFCVLSLAACITVGPKAQAIQLETARWVSIATSVTSFIFLGRDGGFTFAGLGALGLGGTIYGVLYQFTPEGRLGRAKGMMAQVSSNPIVMSSFKREEDVINAVQECYITEDLWLVSAYNNLTRLLEQARSAIELLQAAKEESRDALLVGQCDELCASARTAIKNIMHVVKIIRNNNEYIEQLKLHKKVVAQEKRLEVERRKASAKEARV